MGSRKPMSSSVLFTKRLQKILVLISLCISAAGLNISMEYEPYFRPNNGAVADVCNVSLKILSIREINDGNHMDITLDFVLRQGWTDPRLHNVVQKETIFTREFPRPVWTPDLYIVNSISLARAAETSRTFRLKPEGELILSERLVAKINCPTMSFAKFPFDKHVCHVKIQSYSYNLINLDMVWNGLTPEKEVQIGDPEFRLVSLGQTSFKESTIDGQHRSLVLTITLRRNGLHYMTRAIVPFAFLAFISYLTLFLYVDGQNSSTKSEPLSLQSTRVTMALIRLGVNGLLVLLCTIVGQINLLHAPKAATITGLDVWMSVIGLIVLINFIQNLAVFMVWRVDEKEETNENGLQLTPLTEKCDKWFKIGIPVFFLLFSVIFFAVYLS